jgi:hypothetical protein
MGASYSKVMGGECVFKKRYDPRCERPVIRVFLAAALLLLFPLGAVKPGLPEDWLPFFLSLFLLVLNSDMDPVLL